ncbi:MAG: flagellar hook-basal body complex protein FliE [Defluviitoga tunisiensis]|jgi:flagellar hook-basal body complex protein FliE|uniref:Flagellar hook-basal body complex protein FliE n=1 Tax=Defluviitoga tunisiensis TaxID=1006576 RepID=A0A0C7P2K6_DEFTU|nr:flagellar hook-basal body complex protein FliE [Defluviitoga tunisiensis]MDY0380042.1 flagellar hook-basal body complex protein FliE [Defluviitoga tunisiensis]CEP78560.1 flagellar hook-basal body protein [Defluviitoga tunisiensis]HHV01194.1 flagellar hook-basal body complex protein FliE [Defluviitoga tunisiensis]HOB55062.1 flagellar hook-basal body complex protein FliE [Defluviitoga tunisiensis]HOK15743.1 flagellar hook-basal body complex protein FliE [Defluviitoga tunisiensis]
MVDGINNIKGIGTENINIEKQKQETKKLDFSEMLKEAVEEVNSLQKNADKVAADYASGNITDISQVVISAEKASLSLKLTVEVTNRIVEAYKEIMRMQI